LLPPVTTTDLPASENTIFSVRQLDPLRSGIRELHSAVWFQGARIVPMDSAQAFELAGTDAIGQAALVREGAVLIACGVGVMLLSRRAFPREP